MIPTAEEFYNEHWRLSQPQMAIEFAKLHVEAFRQDLIDNHVEVWDDCNVTPTTSILNAYPLTDIK